MKDMTVETILNVCQGELIYGNQNLVCGDFSKDTRRIEQGNVYVGIKGDNFDGSKLYQEALKKGASICLIEKVELEDDLEKKYPNTAIIVVKDTVKALQQLASYKRNLYHIPVIAITGSVGKTSTKDMLANVTAKKYRVLKTQANYNNHIGLPLTILGLKEHTALVVEMGMNNLGEIRTLTQIARPTIAVITNVGTAHIGNLGSRENILKAKLEILEGLNQDGYLVMNNDNDLLHTWNKKNTKYKVATFGIENQSEIMAQKIELGETTSQFEVKIGKEQVKVNVPVAGIHFIYNALCAIRVGEILEIPKEDILDGIKTFKLTKNRMEIMQTESGIKIISDCYNANYDSMKASLQSLAKMQVTRKIAVLGDMLELGEYAKQLHEKVGKEVVDNRIDRLITVGKEAQNIARQAKKMGMPQQYIYEHNHLETAICQLQKMLKSGDGVLVKASNGMKFNKIVEAIKN